MSPEGTWVQPRRKVPEKTNRFDVRRLFSSAEIVLVGKDLGAIWRSKGTRALLMLLPALLSVGVPLLYSVIISLLPLEGDLSFPPKLAAMLDNPEGYGYRQLWMGAFSTLLCPLLFLCIPIVCSVTAASQILVEEKKSGTLTTLFLSAMDARSLFHAKVTCCTLLSVAISLLSFVAFAITVSVADVSIGAPYFLNFEWIVCLVLLMPVIALFSVVFVSWELPRVQTSGEAMQTMGYLLLPLLLLYLVQFTGIFRITVPFLLGLVLLLAILTVLLFNLSSRQFQPEHFLAQPPED